MTDCQIFINAPDGASEQELSAYLDEACGDDDALRAKVDALFAVAAEAAQGMMGDAAMGDLQKRSEELMPSTEAQTTSVEGKGSLIGNYKLLQQIGEGGFGVVYMAEQFKPVKRRVALKIIKPGMDSRQVVARFEAERQALALMDHPNIAKVHDAGETETGRPFFVMELVKGIPITEFCDDRNLSTGERLELFIDVCRGVQHAHQKGVIHRDLKPSNVMVTLHDDKAMVKVIDFGVAKATQTELTDKTLFTMFEQFIGTPAYMSPEQAQLSGLDIDTRSDIYSLGVLLYELLTSRTPFDQKELMKVGYDEMRRVIREDEPPKPSTRMSTLEDAELTDLAKHRRSEPGKLKGLLRGDLDWIVMKALEKDRTRRYETANALAMDVGRHLSDEPVLAAAPSAGYRIAKYVRRHRGSVLAVSAMMLILIGGVAMTSWQWFRAEENASVASANEATALAKEKEANASRIKADAKEQEATRAAAQLANTLVRSHYSASIEALEAGKPDEALAYLAQALRIEPGFWPAAFETVQVLSDHVFVHEPPQQIPADGSPITWVTASPTEDVVLTGGDGGTGTLWSAANGERLGVLTTGSPAGDRIHGAQFSRDGTLVFAGLVDEGGDIVGFDSRTGQAVTPPFDVSENPDHWFRVGPVGAAGAQLLVEHGEGAMQAIRWTGDRWVAGPLLKLGGKLSLHRTGVDAHPTSRRARGDLYYLEPDGTTFLDQTPMRSRPMFGFSPDGGLIYGSFTTGGTGVWDALTGKPVIAPLSHGDSIKGVRISPDTKHIVIVPEDAGTLLWKRLDELAEPATKVELTFVPARFAFDERGTQLVVTGWTSDDAGRTFHTAVYDLATGEEVSRIEEGSFAAIWSLPAPFVAGRFDWWERDAIIARPWLVGASFDDGSRLKIWDLDSRSAAKEINVGANPVAAFTFLRDGRRLLTQHEDFSVRIWDISSGVPLTEPMAHGWAPYVAFAGTDQTQLVTYDPSVREIRFWDALEGKTLFQSIVHRQKGNWRGHLTAGGSKRLIHLSRQAGESVLGAWSPGIAAPPMQDSFIPTEAPVNHTVFNSAGTQLLGCITTGEAKAGYVRVWDAQTLEMLEEIVHPSGVVYAEFSPTGNSIVSVCLDGAVRLWDRTTSRFVHVFWQEPILDRSVSLAGYMGHKQGQARAHFSPDGKSIATHSRRGAISTFDVESGRFHFRTKKARAVTGLSNLAYSPDGRHLTFCSSIYVSVIDAFSGENVFPEIALESLAEDARFSSDGRYLFASQWPGLARQWDARTGELERVLRTGKDTPWEGFTHFMVHPTKPLVANQTNWGPGSTAGFVHVWNYESGELAMEPMWIGGQSEDHLLDFSPDGQFLGGAPKNGGVVVWEMSTGKRVIHRPSTPGETTFSTDFDQSSTMLAVSSLGGISIVHLPPVAEPAPDWLADLAEAVANKRLLQSGRFERVDREAFDRVKRSIEANNADGRFAAWARWYTRAESRTISPYSDLPLAELALARSRAGNVDAQLRSLHLAPNSGVLHARVAYLMASHPERESLPPMALGRWDDTTRHYLERANALTPDSSEVCALRAAAFEAMGEDRRANSAMKRALVIAPDNPTAWYVKAILANREGEGEAAYRAFVKATALLPSGSCGNAGPDEELLPPLLRNLRSFGAQSSSPRAMALVARSQIRSGRIDQARWLIRRAFEVDPGGREVVAWQARLALDPSEDNLGAAREVFAARVEELGPGGARGRNYADLRNLLLQFEATGQHEEVGNMWVSLIRMHAANETDEKESDKQALRNIAGRAALAGSWEVARISLEILTRDDVQEIRGAGIEWMKLAAVYLFLGDREAHEALAKRMVELYEDDDKAASLERTAKSYFAAPVARESPLSARVLDMARRSTADQGQFASWMALCCGMAEFRMGNPEEAIRQLRIAAETSISEACLALALPYHAMALNELGKQNEARSRLREAEAAIAPFFVSMGTEHYGTVASVWHDRAFAILALREARKQIPGSPNSEP